MTNQILKIGITGGIGSGKSTVAALFLILGIPIYYADDRAKWLMANDSFLIQSIQEHFGKEAYLPKGELNRPHIAKLAFQNPTLLSILNKLVHPAVEKDYLNWHNAQTKVPYTLKEAALLFESGSANKLDAVIEVFAAQKIRIKRVRARDGLSRKQVMSRIKSQMPELEKKKLADYVIYNDGKKGLINQVIALDRIIKKIK